MNSSIELEVVSGEVADDQKSRHRRGTWVAQSVECLTLDFSLGHDFRVLGSSPESGSMLSVQSAWDSLSPSARYPSPQL